MRLGIIELDQKYLLDLMQYPEGIIRAIEIPVERASIIRIQLEHPEMPELESGYHIPTVRPMYLISYDTLGNKIITRQKEKPLPR